MLSSEIPLGVSERDIMDGCQWGAGRISRWRNQRAGRRVNGKIRVISKRRTRQGLVIRSPRPKCVGKDAQTLFAEMTSLKTTGGVF